MIKYLITIFTVFFVLTAEAKTPERIISLSPLITEEVFILGSQDNLVGDTVYCLRPKEAADIEKVGTVVRANIEKIVSLKPDIVLAINLTNPEQIKQLRRLGLNVEVFTNPRTFEEVCSNFLKLASILDREKEAAKIVDPVWKEITEIRKMSKKLPEKKVFIQIGSEPLFAATGEYFVNDFIAFAGGRNIAYGKKGGSYSREAVIKENPDVIIIAEMGLPGEKEKYIWNKYKSIEAVKNNSVHIVDPYKYCSPTPETLPKTLRETIKMVQGL